MDENDAVAMASTVRESNLETALRYGIPPEPPKQITRTRLIELMKLGQETVAFLEEKGLQMGEQCMFREICERIWYAPKE